MPVLYELEFLTRRINEMLAVIGEIKLQADR